MSATKVLWGQIIVVFLIVLFTIWPATEWTAWKLGFQPELGQPWFELARGVPVYLPPAFFWWWWWCAHDAYAPPIFVEGTYIAASGGFISIAVAIGMSVWRAREAKNIETYGSARWATPVEIKSAGLLGPDGVVLGKLDREYPARMSPSSSSSEVLSVIFRSPWAHDGPVCTRSLGWWFQARTGAAWPASGRRRRPCVRKPIPWQRHQP